MEVDVDVFVGGGGLQPFAFTLASLEIWSAQKCPYRLVVSPRLMRPVGTQKLPLIVLPRPNVTAGSDAPTPAPPTNTGTCDVPLHCVAAVPSVRRSFVLNELTIWIDVPAASPTLTPLPVLQSAERVHAGTEVHR